MPRPVIWSVESSPACSGCLYSVSVVFLFFPSTALSHSVCLLSFHSHLLHTAVMETHSQRLLPGDDLYLELLNLAKGWPAACLLSCVGSLRELSVRLAGAEQEKILQGPFERARNSFSVRYRLPIRLTFTYLCCG